MVVPDTVFIAEVLLFSAGFEKAQALAKKVISALKAICGAVHECQHSENFGLREIKAIVKIAERLKL